MHAQDPDPTERPRGFSARIFLRVVPTAGAVGSLAVMSLLQVPLAGRLDRRSHSAAAPAELVQERTASSRTFDNHDGTLTTALYSGPVHFRDVEGAWRLSGSNLVAAGEQGYAWRNEANSWLPGALVIPCVIGLVGGV